MKIENLCKVTQKVMKDVSLLTEQQFLNKYSCSKKRYLKRVIKYGDPYMKAPLAKLGKYLLKKGK